MKNTVSNLILLCVTVVCMSNTGCWGDKDKPCETAPACESENLGVLKLESVAAIPFQGNETVTFVNSQNFQAVYRAQGFKTDTDVELVYKSLDPCGNCREYYQKERRSLLFTGQNLNFSIGYAQVKNVPDLPENTVGLDTATVDDVLLVTLGGSRFAVPLFGSEIKVPAYKGTRLHDSLALGNHLYRQVYEIQGYSDPSVIAPKGIYYTRQQGLVGYFFNNNERWYRL